MDGGLQAFDTWMNAGGPLYISAAAILYLVLAPLFVLVHELGHAVVALVRTDDLVRVQVGKVPAAWRFRFGRLDLRLNPDIPRSGGAAGFAKPLGRFDPYSRMAFALGGPLASGLFSALVLYLALRAHVVLLVWVGAFGLVHTAYALVPRQVAEHLSDGAAFLAALRRLRHGPTPDELLVDMKSRWLSLIKDIDGALGRERGRVLNAVPVLVEHPGTGPDSVAVWKIAFAGWCWRAVDGDASAEMAEAALAAIREAAASGAVEPDLSIIAARALAGRVSSSGYEHVTADMRSPVVDEAKQRWAFQFGVAFYDIEHARGSVG